MNAVEPIRTRRKIAAIKNILKAEKHPRNYLLFTLGINSALRISDLLRLKVKDVIDSKGDIKDRLYVVQKKTKHGVSPRITEPMREAIEHFFNGSRTMEMEDYLFPGRFKGHLTKVQSWNLVNKWAGDVGLDKGRYGTHSLRKTWGYMAYREGCPMEIISEKLGQTSTKSTRRYIGLTQEDIGQWEDKISL